MNKTQSDNTFNFIVNFWSQSGWSFALLIIIVLRMIKEEAVEITKRKVEDGDAKDDKKNSSKVRRRHRGSGHYRITSREEVFCCSNCDKEYGSKERCRRHIKRC